jgi:Apea-like HEPN
MIMSLLWYWRYIPCAGVKLDFDHFDLYEIGERTIVHLTRRSPKQKLKIFQKHIQEDADRLFKTIQGIDFEISLASISGDGVFELDYAHVFTFLLMIRTGGWLSAPIILTHSTLEPPEVDAPHIFCSSFIEARPTYFGDFALTLEDARWIKMHMDTALRFVNEPKFQNAMQALTSFHCIPYWSTRLVVAWSGLEALFGVDQEISFRLCLYVTNFLSGNDRRSEFEKLRRSYDDRSRVAHGAATKAKAVHEHARYTRDILRACLAKCIETNAFPSPKQLIF